MENYKMIKARVAEAIIKEMFRENGYSVYENGMERNMPEIMSQIRNNNTTVAKEIRYSPDFVVLKPDGNMFYLEVKYRKDGKFTFEELPYNYPYTSAHFVIVSQTDIHWITYKQLSEGNDTTKSYFSINKSKIFDLKPEVLEQYRKYVKAFFGGVE